MLKITKQDVLKAENGSGEVLNGNIFAFNSFLKMNNGYEDEMELWETNRNWGFNVDKFVKEIKDEYIQFCKDSGFKPHFDRL